MYSRLKVILCQISRLGSSNLDYITARLTGTLLGSFPLVNKSHQVPTTGTLTCISCIEPLNIHESSDIHPMHNVAHADHTNTNRCRLRIVQLHPNLLVFTQNCWCFVLPTPLTHASQDI